MPVLLSLRGWMEKQMNAFLALVFATTFSSFALAEVPCEGGSPDIFKFVKWDLKTVDPDTTDVTLTIHNATDQDFKESEIKIRWGEWHQFFFKFKILARAKSDTTFVNSFGMPARDAKMLQSLTPTLCAVKTYDENDNKTYYD
jgi:hypothetical protein